MNNGNGNGCLSFEAKLDKIKEIYPISRNFEIKNIKYSKRGFNITLSKESYDKIRKSDIVVFNHKTRQYRTFEFNNEDNVGKHFKCGNIELNIYCTES